MNAVIALNHFCESHGPCVIFCTQTLRSTKVTDITFNANFDRHSCPSCNSIGLQKGYTSKDPETETNFFSSQWPAIPETVNVLKVAATRSLSCETSYNKNGGFVFFGDNSGHILSHTFHVADSHARGFFKLFSITILMKDKTFLLNTEPFLSQHLGNISRELQEQANKVYKEDQEKGSQRAKRLNAGQIISNTARSLMELTGDEHIYGILHGHFAWLLWAGARYLSENLTLGTPSIPPWLGHEIEEGFTMVHIDKEDYLMKKITPRIPSSSLTLRDFRHLKQFYEVLSAIATGVQVVLHGDDDDQNFANCLCTLLPDAVQGVAVGRKEEYSKDLKILSLPSDAEVPENVMKIEIRDGIALDVKNYEEVMQVKGGQKWPTLVNKVAKAVDEDALTEFVLQKRVKVIVEEWKTKVQCLQKVRTVDNCKMKKVLGIQAHDMPLVKYWSTYL